MAQLSLTHNPIVQDWQRLINLGPRFPGTPNETAARQYISAQLQKLGIPVIEETFGYLGWSLCEPPRLQLLEPFSTELPCEAFIYCRATPPGGVTGSLSHVGTHRVIGCFDWTKLAITGAEGAVLAYITGRPDGPAIPQPLDRSSSPLPHFIIGRDALALLESMTGGEKPVILHGAIRSEIDPAACSANLVASFRPDLDAGRIALCAHYDCVYSGPGADDNASGVAVLLAIARRLTTENPLWPVDLLFFSAEEWDLAGSRAYVARHGTAIPARTRLLLNLDGVSKGNALEFRAGPESFEAELKRAVDRFHHPGALPTVFRFPPGAGSDHQPFYEAGVPACMLCLGDITTYHTSQDGFSTHGVDNISAIADLVWHLLSTFAEHEPRWSTREDPTGG